MFSIIELCCDVKKLEIIDKNRGGVSMKGNIPIPGTTRAKLIQVGIRLFSEYGYEKVEVDKIAAEAGVTIGAIYHHFKSKANFYGVLRDDVTRRILDRMEAVADNVDRSQAIKAALLAAYDGVVRIQIGKLFIESDPRGDHDPVSDFIGELAVLADIEEAEELGIVLAAALRAALSRHCNTEGGESKSRMALKRLFS
jgi:AcrR family transcriptional regulator